MTASTLTLERLRAHFGERVQANVPLAPYTSARIGGPADFLLTVTTATELAEAVMWLRQRELPFLLLGGGSNVLVSDRGVRGVVILNRAKEVKFFSGNPPKVWAEAGASLTQIAHRAAVKGLSGLEWAATVPGTLGGAVYGNAGAFGGDIAHSLICAEVLTESGRETWPVEKMGYGYRTSVLKRGEARGIVLSAELALSRAPKEEVVARIEAFSQRRKATQPPGASMGSMFKNPAGDFAGRLIEAAGLKGTRIGNAEISPLHANFFINHGETRARDVRALIELARRAVAEKFGIELELEIELIGEW
ncbi:MAG: UDP-N-acetylmuramate dehydrogenase [Anaerolineae bacterium]